MATAPAPRPSMAAESLIGCALERINPPRIRRRREAQKQNQSGMVDRKVFCFVAAILSPLILAVFAAAGLVAPEENRGRGAGGGGAHGRIPAPEWAVLTKLNFSSQIRSHPHLLLMVTVPWCGESRSIMNEVAQQVYMKQEEFGQLKLMLVYRNSEKMLAESLGASDGVTLIYYHHSVPYKYQGMLQAHNILSSVYYLMLLDIEEVPFKALHSKEELDQFYQSTDKAFILIEFCGWSTNMLKSEDIQSVEEFAETDDTEENFSGEAGGKAGVCIQDPGNIAPNYGAETEVASPWIVEFGSANQSASQENKKTYHDISVFCTQGEFHQFKSFFFKLSTVAREYFLSFERQRFGIISDKSLLPYLGIENLETWLLMVRFSGCPNCSILCKEEEKLQAILKMQHPLVMELDGNTVPEFPAGPSIVLFVDRSSDSSKVRGESKAALESLRKLALHRHISYHINDSVAALSHLIHDTLLSNSIVSNKQTSKASPARKILKMQENVAVMIVNEGEGMLSNMAVESQGNPAYDILARFLKSREITKNTKEMKISLLAKEVGFQLLSDDFDIQVVNSFQSHEEDASSYISSNNAITHIKGWDLDDHKMLNELDVTYANNGDGICNLDRSISETCDAVHLFDVVRESLYNEDYEADVGEKNLQLSSNMASVIVDASGVKTSMINTILNEPSSDNHDFLGSIFFSDGGYTLLGTLSMDSKMPSLVIIDPVSQKHYIFPKEREISYYSLANFVENFLIGNLSSFQRSESAIMKLREFPHPPFVNLDFHEAYSVPRVTPIKFCEIVPKFGVCKERHDIPALKASFSRFSLETDVLVLFSSSWCGFCQRMELIVREVYRAFLSFRIISKDNAMGSQLDGLPSIFQMDCTINDCSSFIEQLGMEENYPVLSLFPAEATDAVIYEGDLSVSSVFDFLDSHGSKDSYLRKHKGHLWSDATWKRSRDTLQEMPDLPIHEEHSETDNKHKEVVDKPVPSNNHPPVGLNALDRTSSEGNDLRPGTIFSATDKILNSSPFDNATLLIVTASFSQGFQGVIISKRISWNVFKELDAEIEFLKLAPLFYGGPIMMEGLPLVSLSRKYVENYTEICADIFFGDPMATSISIKKIKSGELPVGGFWFFLGYSSWEWNQLLNEFTVGAWSLSNYSVSDMDWPES